MDILLIGIGIACVLAAIAGGGLKAANIQIPVLHRPFQYVLFGLIGVGLFSMGVWVHYQKEPSPPTGISLMINGTQPYNGPCPVNYHYTGSITVTGGQGWVKFNTAVLETWGPARGTRNVFNGNAVYFSGPGTIPISGDYLVSAAEAGDIGVQIYDPVTISSSLAPYKVSCTIPTSS